MSVLALIPLVLLATSLARADQWRSLVPEPFIEGRERWIELYWKAWDLFRSGIREGTGASGLVSRYVGATDGRVWQLETALLVACGRYGHRAFPTAISLDNFYRKQHADGFICAGIVEANGRDAAPLSDRASLSPPLLAWAEWQHYLLTADRSRLRFAFPYLSRHFWWLDTNLRTPSGALSAGVGTLGQPGPGVVGSVEMTCLQALNARCLAEMARALQSPTDESRFRKQAEALGNVANAVLWCEEAGFYCDVDSSLRALDYERDEKRIPRLTLAGAYALVAGVPQPERARRLADRLGDRNGFLRAHSLSTLSAGDPIFSADSSGRGAVSPIANYLVVRGLEEQGLRGLAQMVAENHIEGISRTLSRTGFLWDLYASDAFRPAQEARPDPLGLSVCSAVALLLESVLGIEVNAPAGEVRWNIRQTVRHGVHRLPLGEATIDLSCETRRHRKAPAKIRVKTDRAFALIVSLDGKQSRRKIAAGDTEFEISP